MPILLVFPWCTGVLVRSLLSEPGDWIAPPVVSEPSVKKGWTSVLYHVGSGLVLLACLTVYVVSAPRFHISEETLTLVEQGFGSSAVARVLEWQRLVREQQRDKLTELEQLEAANAFFNQVAWVSDELHWGQEDYWATPIETLASNGGDCEDFSIAKYFSLAYAGFDTAKLRITYVKSLTYDQAHMVLAYYSSPEAEPLILDNINKAILPASERSDLVPVYSFNAEHIWLARARGEKLNAKSTDSLPQWRRVNEKMLSERLP